MCLKVAKLYPCVCVCLRNFETFLLSTAAKPLSELCLAVYAYMFSSFDVFVNLIHSLFVFLFRFLLATSNYLLIQNIILSFNLYCKPLIGLISVFCVLSVKLLRVYIFPNWHIPKELSFFNEEAHLLSSNFSCCSKDEP